MIKAITTIFEEKKEAWHLDDSDKADYVETLSCRFLNICRVVGHAQHRATKPSWYKALPWAADAAKGEADPGGAAAARPAADWICGFDQAFGSGPAPNESSGHLNYR